MLKEIAVQTNTQTQIIDITAQIQKVVRESGISIIWVWVLVWTAISFSITTSSFG